VGLKIFCVCTLVFWLMVLMITEFACQEAQKKLRLACAFHAHQHASSSILDFRLLTLFGSLTLTLTTPAIFGSKGTTKKAEKI
jgi:hypothetical protein